MTLFIFCNGYIFGGVFAQLTRFGGCIYQGQFKVNYWLNCCHIFAMASLISMAVFTLYNYKKSCLNWQPFLLNYEKVKMLYNVQAHQCGADQNTYVEVPAARL